MEEKKYKMQIAESNEKFPVPSETGQESAKKSDTERALEIILGMSDSEISLLSEEPEIITKAREFRGKILQLTGE